MQVQLMRYTTWGQGVGQFNLYQLATPNKPRLYDIPGYLHACRTALQDNGLQKKMKPGILQFSRNQDATRD